MHILRIEWHPREREHNFAFGILKIEGKIVTQIGVGYLRDCPTWLNLKQAVQAMRSHNGGKPFDAVWLELMPPAMPDDAKFELVELLTG